VSGVCPSPNSPSTREPSADAARYRTLTLVGALLAPAASVLWLGLTLTADGASVAFALIKIVFTIIVVITGLAGVRWATASGSGLLLEALAVALWIVLRVEDYAPHGAMRTALMLAVPLAVSGILLILADGMRAGTWPPARFRETASRQAP